MMLGKVNKNNPLVQVITIDEQSRKYGLNLIISLRKLEIKTRYDHKINIKKSLKQANEAKIKFARIVGTTEVKNNNYTVKNLFEGAQQTQSFDE